METNNTKGVGITRRGFLKSAQAVAILGASGPLLENALCSVSQAAVIENPNPKFDTEMKVINSHHRIHCHGSCMVKTYTKNGRIVKISSMGDIKREGSVESDEDIIIKQRRACPRGLAEKKRLYSPDRLKYPMKQTKERGDISGFVRISWQEAATTVAKWLNEMKEREKELGYLPIWAAGDTPAKYLGVTLGTYGHHSAGNQMDAMHAAIGAKVQGNPAIDVLNSKFIIIWSTDTRSTQAQHTFLLTKAKEAGIPIIVVDSRYTDTAASFGTGKGKIPGWVAVRPGTDGALLSAMAYVIYKKKLHDEKFIKDYCFGFYPKDSVVSKSANKDLVTGEECKGKTFVTPEGESFVEYLEKLEKDNKNYKGVLAWASKITGVPANVIEALGLEYGKASAASFFCGWTTGGAQRTGSGLYYSWLLIALSAMTGNIIKRGGGFGMVAPSDGYKIKLGKEPAVTDRKAYKPILFSAFFASQVINSGKDARSGEQLSSDVKHMNGIDLGNEPRLHMEMVYKGAGSGDPFNQRSNTSKKVDAWKKLKYVVSYEFHLSPTARWSDIVLPAAMNLEQSFFTNGQMNGELDVANKASEIIHECKPDWEINKIIAKELGIEINRLSDEEVMKAQWKSAEIPESYKKINPKVKLPSFEEIVTEGEFKMPMALNETYIDVAKYKPGEFPTDTGRINFYSPFLKSRGRVGSGVCRAGYVRQSFGYEDILEGKKGAKGVKYGLQFITPHVIHRSHSSFDNVPLMQDTYSNAVEINPIDGEKRGIKDGALVYVYNDSGCIKLPARITKRIMPGVIAVYEGRYYNPDYNDMYEAYLDTDGSGVLKKVKVPVDAGGCVTTITTDLEGAAGDPLVNAVTNKSGGFTAGGLCEISPTKIS